MVRWLKLPLLRGSYTTLHIDTVSADALRKLFFLGRAFKFSTPVRVLAYNTIIRPMLEYAVTIWDPFTQTNIKKLGKI